MIDPLKLLSAGGCESPCEYVISVVNPLGMLCYRSGGPITWSPVKDHNRDFFPTFGKAMDEKLRMLELGFALGLNYYSGLRIEEVPARRGVAHA